MAAMPEPVAEWRDTYRLQTLEAALHVRAIPPIIAALRASQAIG